MKAGDFDDAVLGLALPEGVEAALQEAGALRREPERAMAALMRAQRLAPDHPAVIIALYRHHFYGHRLHAARDVARRALAVGAEALGLPLVWRQVPPEALSGARHDPRTRFYLFVLKGYAYLSLRLQDLREAGDVLALLRALDPEDCVGGALLEVARRRAIAGRSANDEDEGENDEPAPYAYASGRNAWSRAEAA